MLTTEDTAPVSEESGDNRKKSVFSLVEIIIIVVICIFSIIVLYPVYQKYRDNKNQKTCMNNQQQIAASILMYSIDHENFLPGRDWFYLIRSGFSWQFDCPATKIVGTTSFSEYGYNQYLNDENNNPLPLTAIPLPAATLLTADYKSAPDTDLFIIKHSYQISKRHNNKAIVSYVDGHVAIGEIYQFKNIDYKK